MLQGSGTERAYADLSCIGEDSGSLFQLYQNKVQFRHSDKNDEIGLDFDYNKI